MVRASFALLIIFSLLVFSFSVSNSAHAVFLDGDGQYTILGKTRTRPHFSTSHEQFQVMQQFFRFDGMLRANDQTAFHFRLGLFEDPRRAYLGDVNRPEDCTVFDHANTRWHTRQQRRGSQCVDSQGRRLHQDTAYPSYEPYKPQLVEAYVRYGFEYCILEAGRRSRHWGMGAMLDDGKGPFDVTQSLYDGVTCDFNLFKSQTLGFKVGYDKLSETGRPVELDSSDAQGNNQLHYNPEQSSDVDDLDQFFASVEYDDRKANAGSGFTRQVGIYLAKVQGAKTDITFVDLYTGFHFTNFSFRNEIVFRLGKSADPTWQRYGAPVNIFGDDIKQFDLQSIGILGDFSYTFSRSGSYVGPEEYNQGNATSHGIRFEYAYAPGDSDGYWPAGDDQNTQRDSRLEKRSDSAKAMGFHRNYKPALILFNEQAELDHLRVDGVYDPSRFMNASLFALSYEMKSLDNGDLTVKLIHASLNEVMPSPYKRILDSDREASMANTSLVDDIVRWEVGYEGDTLGQELDVIYNYRWGKNLSFGGAMAVALPGNAFQTEFDKNPEVAFLIQSHVTVRF